MGYSRIFLTQKPRIINRLIHAITDQGTNQDSVTTYSRPNIISLFTFVSLLILFICRRCNKDARLHQLIFQSEFLHPENTEFTVIIPLYKP